ncbi:two-component system, OmpR family, sensor histidine kinase KdpD [Syntrophus gentianae]|uniref:Two-component system, OmpR family, sensor histidine kinase KdpD n=1 Tax=Syntrophus gentianae TaxID=43775 RepID=A0A1H7VNX2_9BACT|nr:PTS sugar transporter subunit IIA [Syntrophus gentianae]SEM10714.1 two-component system, OmpR family, sensor histidine kinase KdpD [Syntrophus gentianae]
MNADSDRADAFLRMIRRAERGRLKVYLGYAAGVGKTWQMLQEAHRLRQEGIDVVVGLVETHGRIGTAKLLEGLEILPRFVQPYHGILVEEMDVDAVLRRKPQVVLVDELAHTNVPGSRNAKRYEDVQDLLAAGIHVMTTLNVQHLESLYNIVEKAVGVRVRERLPDSILAEADQIVNVDLTPEDLQERLKEGKIYPLERIPLALNRFFRTANLENLREMTLREMAAQIDLKRHETEPEEEGIVPDQIMVCLSSRGPNSKKLLRYASRLAGRFNRNWYAVYVQTPSEEATVIDAQTQLLLSGTLTLAKELGAMVFTYKGDGIAETILRFAREYQVGHIVIGSPAPLPFWKRLLGEKSIADQLMERSRGVTIVVLDTRPSEFAAAVSPTGMADFEASRKAPEESLGEIPPETRAASAAPLRMTSLLEVSGIRFWEKPVSQEEVLETLVRAACGRYRPTEVAVFLRAVRDREVQGSTFFNEGVAFPHARVAGLDRPLLALGLTRGGISDVVTEKPIDYVFLSLTPLEQPEIQVSVLALGAHALQNRQMVQLLKLARTAEEVHAAVREWEQLSRLKETNPSSP